MREAVLVFKPEKRRGANGVMLSEFYGVGDLKEYVMRWVGGGHDKDTAIYPLGIPQDMAQPVIHLELGTQLINGAHVNDWQKFHYV